MNKYVIQLEDGYYVAFIYLENRIDCTHPMRTAVKKKELAMKFTRKGLAKELAKLFEGKVIKYENAD